MTSARPGCAAHCTAALPISIATHRSASNTAATTTAILLSTTCAAISRPRPQRDWVAHDRRRFGQTRNQLHPQPLKHRNQRPSAHRIPADSPLRHSLTRAGASHARTQIFHPAAAPALESLPIRYCWLGLRRTRRPGRAISLFVRRRQRYQPHRRSPPGRQGSDRQRRRSGQHLARTARRRSVGLTITVRWRSAPTHGRVSTNSAIRVNRTAASAAFLAAARRFPRHHRRHRQPQQTELQDPDPTATIGIRGTGSRAVFFVPVGAHPFGNVAPGTYDKVNTGEAYIQTPQEARHPAGTRSALPVVKT